MPTFTERLLWFRALDYLRTYHPFLIAVAGSVNNAVTKDLITRALSHDFSVFTPPQPYSNPRNVALSIVGQNSASHYNLIKLLSFSFIRELREHEPTALVLELGVNKPGEMDWMAQKLPVNLAVITNIGTVHTDIFGSQALLAHEMSSLVAALPASGLAILNVDDPLVADMAQHTQARVVTFGQSDAAHVRLMRFNRLESFGFAGEIKVGSKTYELHLPHIIAHHQLTSVLAAIAVAEAQHLNLSVIIKRLQNYRPSAGHHNLVAGPNGSRLLDASFDASPESMLADLDTLRTLPARRRIAVLAGIPGIDYKSVALHQRFGQAVAETDAMFIGIGAEMKDAQAAALRLGADTHHFATALDAGKWMSGLLCSGDLVLITGSQSYRLNQLISRLTRPVDKNA